jgi:hypothetical protein
MASPSVFARGVDHSLELVDEHLAPEQVKARRDSESRSFATRLAIWIVLRLMLPLRCLIGDVYRSCLFATKTWRGRARRSTTSPQLHDALSPIHIHNLNTL